MHTTLSNDLQHLSAILEQVLAEAKRFLTELDSLPAGVVLPEKREHFRLAEDGMGASEALELFRQQYAAWMSGSAGPRYFGLVTGGVTPAALAGDWLVSVYDQNNVGADESIAPRIELETLGLLRELFGLPEAFSGSFVSGATMANFVGLALGRQWLGHQLGVDFAAEGVWKAGALRVFSGSPHSSVYKALAMLGMGRSALTSLATLPGREALDVAALEEQLKQLNGQPCIVVANAGTVNTVDFDDLAAIAGLRARQPFWLHVDAAFGGYAACSPKYRGWVRGIEAADSITIDAHKWLNVPYDAAMQFSRHLGLQAEVFQNAAGYLEQTISSGSFIHLTPENSRRLRALPGWFTLMAYGRSGYAEIVERDCQLAQWLGRQIEKDEAFALLAPVRLNGVCFTFKEPAMRTQAAVKAYLKRLQQDGRVFLTPTIYQGMPAVRASITNWRTSQADVELAWQAMRRLANAEAE